MRKNLFIYLIALCIGSAASAQITIFPNFTDFENHTLCGTSCSGACNLIGAWRNADQWGFAQAGSDWLVEDGSTPSTATGPDVDHTLGSASGKYVYFETSGCNNTTAFLVSDIYNFTNLSAPKITFWYHMLGATMGTMHLDVDTTGLGNWVLNVTPQWTANLNIWQEKTVDLTAYGGRPSVRLRIRGQSGTSFTSDMAVDDITVFQPAPYDVNVISVNAGGGCGNSVTTPVVLEYANNGSDTLMAGDTIHVSFQIGGNTVMDTLVLSANILPGDTATYTFVNGFADLSGPSNVTITAWATFTGDGVSGNDTTSVVTIGIPIITSYPYDQDFEQGQAGWRINNGTVGSWAFGTPAKVIINSAASGVNSFVNGGLTGSYADNDNSYVEGPCFDFTNVCDPTIQANVWWNAEFSWDGMNITASSDGGLTWVLVGAFGDAVSWYNDNSVVGNPGGFQSAWSGRLSSNNGSNGWRLVRHKLNGFGGQSNVKIRFNFGSDGSVVDEGVAFDDVKVYDGVYLGVDQTACSPSTVYLNAYTGVPTDDYLWSTGDTIFEATITQTGWYSLQVTSGLCVNTDSIYVVVIDSNTTVNLGADTTVCGNMMLDAGYFPGATYTWSNGATTQMTTGSMTNSYSVSVNAGCATLGDTIALVVNPNPSVNLGPDATACGSYLLDAGNSGNTYLWSNTATTQTVNATTTGAYSVVVTDSSGCQGSDTVNVVINAVPTINLGPDQLLCNGASATLDAGAGFSYLWSTTAVTQTISVSAAGAYSVAATDSNGCVGKDTINITTGASPVAGFTSSVSGAGLNYSFTNTSTGATSYAWDFGDGNTSTAMSPSHTYAAGTYTVTLIATGDCGADTLTQVITVVGMQDGLANGVAVYPNPNSGAFQVKFHLDADLPVTLTVENLAGQTVYIRDLGQVVGEVNHDVMLNSAPAGIYFLRLRSGELQSVQKILVK